MKKSLLVLSLLTFSVVGCNNGPTNNKFDIPYESFNFSLEWGIGYDSSYNSETKELVKFKNVTERKPEEYITTYEYPKLKELYDSVKVMNPYAYPDKYDPFEGNAHLVTAPSTNYKLTVGDKTIEVNDFPVDFHDRTGLTKKGGKLVDILLDITQTIQESDEWKALPDFEKLYS